MIIASIIVLVFGFTASAGFADCSIFSHLKFQPAGFAIRVMKIPYLSKRLYRASATGKNLGMLKNRFSSGIGRAWLV
jgi:hypothetical protein